MRKLILISIVVLSIMNACGPSQEDLAGIRLTKVENFLEANDTTNALANLDSVTILYPKAAYSINAAKNMKNEILWDIVQKKEIKLDTINLLIEELERNFDKEKTEFDRYTQYIHKRQNFDRRWDKSFLQIHLDERGELYLSSNYNGEQWLNHTGIRVYDDPDQAKTDTIPLDDINNHRSDFMESKWEKVTYRNGADNGVIEFIANNTERRLKAVFLGNQYYYIILEDYDKQAVKEALALSKAITTRLELEKEVNKLNNELGIQQGIQPEQSTN